ncbi:MAG: CoA-binding protein [Planctomycetes bacterium]|nr:CoA-binding protein [Planctomycetota bacterium]
MECEFPKENASNPEIDAILDTYKTIAVVGLSDKPDRPSYGVSEYMKAQGYRIIPVNPAAETILGEKSYPSVAAIPEAVEIVNIFRKPDAVPAIVDEAIAKGAKVVWMQDGIVHNAAADKARAAGLKVVMSKCLYREHRRHNG